MVLLKRNPEQPIQGGLKKVKLQLLRENLKKKILLPEETSEMQDMGLREPKPTFQKKILWVKPRENIPKKREGRNKCKHEQGQRTFLVALLITSSVEVNA